MTLQLAHKLDKNIYEFTIVEDNDILVPETYKGFLYSLIHVFKNSVEHGIESYKERNKLNKDERGSISCFLSIQDNMIKIVISDDGRGINIEKLKEKISKKYPEQDVTNLSNNEIYQFIFKDQISTMDKVSKTSGRGVGMSAVKSELDKINGKIEIKSNMGVGTTFIFMVPNS